MTIMDKPRVSWDTSTVYTYSVRWSSPSDSDLSNTTVRHIADISRSNLLESYKIKNYLKLEPNWDSYGAAAISEQSVEKAIAFIAEIDKYSIDVYMTSPGPNGEVLVHLRSGKREIEFLFYADKAKYVLFDSNEYESQGSYTSGILNELIDWLGKDA
jgi:hypothetical protein